MDDRDILGEGLSHCADGDGAERRMERMNTWGLPLNKRDGGEE